jgi:alpha/beta superfamily hydrolase
MPINSNQALIQGLVGNIELLMDTPSNPPKGIALIAHPQPLLGGSALHKVPAWLARSAAEKNWLAVRPNFRGVGQTDGQHDQGVGETEDMLCTIEYLRKSYPTLPLALIGFSFGAFVQACTAYKLGQSGKPAAAVALFGVPVGTVATGRTFDTPMPIAKNGHVLIVHGECDEIIEWQAVVAWAKPQQQVVTLVPGSDHYFNGALPALKTLVQRHLFF